MLEMYSFVDYFTIPPSFVSIYLDRTWIGKYVPPVLICIVFQNQNHKVKFGPKFVNELYFKFKINCKKNPALRYVDVNWRYRSNICCNN